MATCVATSKNEQRYCDFYEKASFEDRCSHLYEECNNHCRSLSAMDFSKIHGVIRREDATPVEEFIISPPTTVAKVPSPSSTGNTRHPCTDCLSFTGCPLLGLEEIARNKKILVSSDYWDIGSNCSNYIDNNVGVSI